MALALTPPPMTTQVQFRTPHTVSLYAVSLYAVSLYAVSLHTVLGQQSAAAAAAARVLDQGTSARALSWDLDSSTGNGCSHGVGIRSVAPLEGGGPVGRASVSEVMFNLAVAGRCMSPSSERGMLAASPVPAYNPDRRSPLWRPVGELCSRRPCSRPSDSRQPSRGRWTAAGTHDSEESSWMRSRKEVGLSSRTGPARCVTARGRLTVK